MRADVADVLSVSSQHFIGYIGAERSVWVVRSVVI